MKKVMLVNPPQKYYELSASFSLYFPLGLLSVAAAIKDVCNVKIFDCLVSDFEIKIAGEFVLYGIPFEKIETEIKKLWISKA